MLQNRALLTRKQKKNERAPRRRFSRLLIRVRINLTWFANCFARLLTHQSCQHQQQSGESAVWRGSPVFARSHVGDDSAQRSFLKRYILYFFFFFCCAHKTRLFLIFLTKFVLNRCEEKTRAIRTNATAAIYGAKTIRIRRRTGRSRVCGNSIAVSFAISSQTLYKYGSRRGRFVFHRPVKLYTYTLYTARAHSRADTQV